MKYHVLTMIPFKDIHTKEQYEANQELIVSEERALELFSSKNHLVRFLSREENPSEESLNENKKNDLKNNEPLNDNYDSLNFKELEALALERNLDVTGANSKDKLRELLRKN